MQRKLSKLYVRSKRKILKLIKNVVYHNYSFKPTGIYQLSKEYSSKNSKANYIEIYPDLVTDCAVSDELYTACSEYIKPQLKVIATYFVVAIPDGRVHTDNAISVAIISHDQKLIADVSFSYRQGKLVKAEENSIFKLKYFRKPKKYSGSIFTLLTGGAGVNNYFHWIIDVLPRLHLLQMSGLFESVDYFLVPAYKYEFQKQTLQLLGIKKEQIIDAEKQTHIEADTLIATNAPRSSYSLIPLWVCNFLRASFLKQHMIIRTSPAYIYISRRDSIIRQVTNEAAIVKLLAQYGFQVFVLSSLSFPEQLCLFASARIIIAPHGAGLVNLVFCNKNTKVVEIFAEGYVKASYYDLSQKVQLAYTHLICKSPKPKTIKEGMKLNIQIDLAAFQTTLRQLLA